MRSIRLTSEKLKNMSRRELMDRAIARINRTVRNVERLRASPYHDAREFMQHEADLQFKMDHDQFEYLDKPDKIK